MVGKRVRDAVRALVIRDSLRGQPVSDIAEWTGKHKSTVYRIKNQYDASGYSSAPKHSNLGRPGKIEDGIGMLVAHSDSLQQYSYAISR
ncbi:hypothetical protein SAICODRAFT_128729 [Saitoella complicata NRRL Y-17804]|uniref:uncharacterized protein n=1 Tax=Saitoella complicata (strain BCRC 22490 / CBS 7301 / JCM 7358 / NBRC 10748 / NRRL Y-17804) TaxID=698492 RepID=UPI0008673607|nr:uncharacterized protein SAICODRAFT_128729 [Saitoella complicata NRRL Y-17804]ODQ52434.1 hypothetical protein SAICODRAFT_128729 [Saitoella complicata NRRL Y-17804]